jgi:hypothetical protein
VRLPARSAGLLLFWGAVAALPGCAPTAPVVEGPAAGAARISCASEAEQLLQPVAVHAEPAPRSALLLELDRGRFVYRCERRGEWLAIMFPAADEAVDCSQRPAGRPCPIGWVQGDVATATFG